MAVVKADGYGHGDVRVAQAALEAGASWLGVALVEEGIRLREHGVDAPVLVLSEFPPGSEGAALAAGLTPSLYSAGGLDRLIAAAGGAASRIGVHVKVDTGMHRVGLWPPEGAVSFMERVARAGFALEGIWTHFARADDDPATTKEQIDRFGEVVEAVSAAGLQVRLIHAANTAGTIGYPEARFDLVRVGIGIYGVEPAPGLGASLGLRPAMSWRSRVSMAKRLAAGESLSYGHRCTLERDSWIATVPVGYADGYPRALSNLADVVIGGRRCRVAGSVTMDQLLADCGEIEPAPGDDVVLIGTQQEETITAQELGSHAGTIAYEVLARVGARVPRTYLP
jgi:alanine racemase